ncbi:DUF167 domain-containing protein [Tellurirhabdus rosea]|uniref:DUF167 domain-containing protein n=1 Tax=Tellurirhabdus rosea TaxID=2674997 RepID=UPI002250A04C|nr:DUF167 domain-containing protein [Tellurirhabdus rosea]
MTLHLKVKPGSKVDLLFYDAAGLLNAKIKAPAQDGRANAYLTEFLARQLGLARSRVVLVSGFTNPHKKLEIDADEALIREKLSAVRVS